MAITYENDNKEQTAKILKIFEDAEQISNRREAARKVNDRFCHGTAASIEEHQHKKQFNADFNYLEAE